MAHESRDLRRSDGAAHAPAQNVGGGAYRRALRGPFPEIPLVPTGGMTLDSAMITFRWFGPRDSIPLAYIRQIPAVRGIVEDEDEIERYPTFEESALAKARHFHALSGGMPTIGDYSGLVVDGLGGAPSVLSKTFSGRSDLSGVALDVANNEKLMRVMALFDRESESRDEERVSPSARYVCDAGYVSSNGEITREGGIEERIIDAPRGSGGFGYDPYFESPELGGTFAEADWALKSRVGHRGRAFRALIPALRKRSWE